ncbi:hypothetical protein EH222_05605 [candidate division KSB1 bacterium]|nr:MAG: hypothetical protein EH222_05605 [candidate division KSB1 bacterium]
MECEAKGTAQFGQYKNLGTATAWYEDVSVQDDDPSHYVGEKFTPTEPDDFAVCISFKDKDGNYVGDVLAYLTIPGQEKKWKVLSSWNEVLAGGMWPCNCLFRALMPNVVGGTYSFKFYAPAGWKFISPDHMEIEIPEGNSYYSVSGNIFYLERITATDDSPAPPADQGSVEPNSLLFISGSPTAEGEGWDNLVDGDLEGSDGTTTAQNDLQNNAPAYGIFRFADGNIYNFSQVKIQTDNGTRDNGRANRQASRIDVQVSMLGLRESDFVSIGSLKVKPDGMQAFELSKTVKAKYVKVVLRQSNRPSDGWIQAVEFVLDSPAMRGPELASEEGECASIPTVFRLQQNYPNPFNPVTTLSYDLPNSSRVTLRIHDINGRTIAVLVDEQQNAGSYSVSWDASAHASGLSFCHLQAGPLRALRKMTLIR